MPTINNQAAGLREQIEEEIRQYLTEDVEISEGQMFSQPKMVRRIGLFESQTYPNGKLDSQGNYKFWYDIITPRVDSDVKNIDFDTKDIGVYSPRKIDELADIITSLKLTEYLRETGQAEEINTAIEEFSGWGNVVWKRVKKSFERVDLRNFYVINQKAQCLKESPVIERHPMTQPDLRAKSATWKNVKEVIETLGSKTYKSQTGTQEQDTTIPYYEIYERNGEVCLADLKEVRGEPVSDEDKEKYVFARVIAAGEKGTDSGVTIKYILFADELVGKTNEDIYQEAHRGRYKGRWWRVGLIEALMDVQVRANQIGNQIAQGLEFASKTFFQSPDKLIYQNVFTDMKNGDIIRATDLKHVEVRMNGFDQLMADWNRCIGIANEIANSREIVQGDSLPAGTPFRLGALYNQNANKLFDFLREKLAAPFGVIFEKWLLPDLVTDLKAEDVIRLTGDSEMLKRLYMLIVDSWYIENLVALGPHSQEEAVFLKSQKLQELMSREQLMMKALEDVFKGYVPHASIIITGENSRKDAELQTYASFIQLEMDPVRRSYLIEKAMKRSGMDVGDLPRTPPQQMAPKPPAQEQPVPAGNEK